MLEFLVLGVIPGTTIQITFSWFLGVFIVAGSCIVLRVTYQYRYQIYRLIKLAYSQYLRPAVKQLLIQISRQYTLTK
jgi:hypothetical protein